MSTRRQTWQSINRRKGRFRAQARPVFMKALETQIEPLYELIAMSQVDNVVVPELNNDPILDAYKKLYVSASLEFARFDRRNLKSMAGIELLKDEDAIIDDIIMQDIMAYLATDVGSTITAIGDTSIKLLRKLLGELIPEVVEMGLGAGEAQTMLRDMVQSKWHETRYFRTERIVRTETNAACNWGGLKGVRSTGMPTNKIWLASFLERQDHMQADGQEVDINDPFDVGGEHLDFPGDPGGSAKNTINCACGIAYSIKT